MRSEPESWGIPQDFYVGRSGLHDAVPRRYILELIWDCYMRDVNVMVFGIWIFKLSIWNFYTYYTILYYIVILYNTI